ncbi:MAG: hypothetical protein WBL19_02840 [Minisyncoccia bacterium]
MNNRRKTDSETSRDPVERLLLFLWIGFALVGIGLWVHIANWIAVWWTLETFPSVEQIRNTVGYWLGNQLLVYGIVLLAIVVAITSAIVVAEKKRFERTEARFREMAPRREPIGISEHQKKNERVDLDIWEDDYPGRPAVDSDRHKP